MGLCISSIIAAAAISIALPDSPTPVESSASVELADAIARMTGTRPACATGGVVRADCVLYVGDTHAAAAATNEAGVASWEYDEVFVRSVPGGVVFTGHPVRGPIYAVDEWLERKCGVRWWTSTESEYPRLSELPVRGVSIRHVPSFKYRETYYLDGFNADFKVRLKGNFSSLTRCMLSPMQFIPPEKGGNHRLYFFKGRRSSYHSFFEVLPPGKYFGEHPEWYSFATNRNLNKRLPLQLCLTNREMTDEFIREVKRRLREDPTADFISISQNDSSPEHPEGVWPCSCPECIAVEAEEGGVHSGPILRFANRVAEGLEAEFPHVTVDTFAYSYSFEPPAKTRARHNVVVRFCDIACPVAVPLDMWGIPHSERLMAALRGWSRAAPGRLFVWDYTTNFSNYMLPHPNLFTLGPNVRIFAASGAVGVFEQGDALCSAGSFNPLKNWVLAHLLWDASADDLALIDEFTRRYYGERAAPYLNEYYRVVDKAALDARALVNCYHAGVDGFMTPATVHRAALVLGKAVEAAESEGAPYAARVRREQLSTDHAVILEWDTLRELYRFHGWVWPFPATRREAVERWADSCRRFGVVARKETVHRDEFEKYIDKLMKEKTK